MARYIDADALKELWQPDHNRKFDADYFIHTIDNAPTADVAEVVRCKDCVYYDPWVCWLNGIETEDSWFCANGKRRE